MSNNSNLKVFINGLITENPTFVLLLGMCPTLGTTSSAANGMGMGVLGVWIAMCLDWVVRALCFSLRYRGSRWQLPADVPLSAGASEGA